MPQISPPKLLDHVGGGLGGAAGRQQIVADENALAGLDRVFVNLQRVLSVLQVVFPLQDFGRQLLWFANRDEAGVQPIRQRGTKDESARLDAQDQLDVVVDVVLGEGVDQAREAATWSFSSVVMS